MQLVVNGLISGLCIGLLALAFQVVYMPTRIFFVGLAGLYVVAPYMFNAAGPVTGNLALAGLVAVLGTAAMAVAMELLNHRPLERRVAAEGVHFISSLGLYIVIVEVVAILGGNGSQQLDAPVGGNWSVAGLIFTRPQVTMAVISGLCLALFFVTLHRSSYGLRMRALSDDPVQFALYGHDVDTARLSAFAAAGAFAAVAALLTAFDLGFDPHTGLSATSIAIVAVFAGGRRSFTGPVLCGIALGVVRSQVAWQLDAKWQDAVTFAIMGLFILFRPKGLFGGKIRLELGGA